MDVLSGHGLGDWLSVGDKPVVVGLLDPFIDDCSRPDVVHLWSQDSSLVQEQSRAVCVASRLRKEDRDWVSLSHLVQSLVSGDLKGVLWVAPLIGVQAKEIDGIVGIVAAGEIVLEHWTELGDVGGGIANWGLAHTFRIAIGLHVASCCLNERCNLGLVGACNDLVADKHAERIGVVGEGIEVGSKGLVLRRGPDSSLLARC